MLKLIIFVNKENKTIIVDCKTDSSKCQPNTGYETDCDDWSTQKEEYMQDDDIFFDKKKAFKEPGIYEVKGYDNSQDTQDGFMEDYTVENITKIAELPY